MNIAAALAPRSPAIRMRLINLLLPVAITVVALFVGLLLVTATGASIANAASAFWIGAVGSNYAIGVSLNRAVPYALVGLGFIFSAKANLTNVGGEGQICMGGILATAVALHGAANLPHVLAIALPLLAGAAGGALWGALAGVLKVRRGTNEVISTLLLSFVGLELVNLCVHSVALLRRPPTSASTMPESDYIPAATKLPELFADPSSTLHAGVILALIAAIVVGVVLAKSTFGVRLRAIGLNPLASQRAGMSQWLMCSALALAGALGGLAGAIMIQGDQFVLKTGFSSGYGFDGVVVGLLSRGSATGVVVCALFFGFLQSGGMSMQIMAGVPAQIVAVCQGLIVIAIAGSTGWLDHRYRPGVDR